MSRILLRSIGALVALLMVPGAQAAIVMLNGTTINYQYDTVINSAALLIFGTPTIQGDVIRFIPPSFRAESIDGAGTDTITAEFVFDRVFSINGEELTQIQVLEIGDYEITNADNVTADLLLSMTNNNNALEFTSDAQTFSAFGSSGGLQAWQLTSTLDPSFEFSPVANDVEIGIRNTLTATTNAFGQSAWIQKKFNFVASTAATTIVPVPAAAWLFGSALGLLGWMRRRKLT